MAKVSGLEAFTQLDRLNATDLLYLRGEPIESGRFTYDGVEDEASTIESMDPADHQGELWYALDTQLAYKAVSSPIFTPSEYWQAIGIVYDPNTDSYELPETRSGQTQNIGQELFFNAFNDGDAATQLSPKVFISTGAKTGSEEFKSVIRPVSPADIVPGSLIGINTTDALTNQHTKLILLGDVKGVDTSMWGLNSTLYAGPDGDLTSTQPAVNAVPVAKVTVVDAVDGQLFVDTIKPTRIDREAVPSGIQRNYFAGDEITLASGTYYETLEDKGTVQLETQQVVCGDNQTTAVTQDHITIQALADFTIPAGRYEGIVQLEVNTASGNEQVKIEIYLADANGNVIDAGTGLPNGDLGVPPIGTLSSAVLDHDANDIFFDAVETFLETSVDVVVGQRVRFHTLCSKIGTTGGNKTFTLYYGLDASTWVDSPIFLKIEDVNGLPEALDERVKWVDPWVNGTYDNRTMVTLEGFTMMSNKETSDYPAPTPEGEAGYLVPDAPTWTTLNQTAYIQSGLNITNLVESYQISVIRAWIPSKTSSDSYRIAVRDNITGIFNISATFKGDTVETGWNNIVISPVFITPGDDISFYLQSQNVSGTTNFNHSFFYTGSSNQEVDPGVGNVNVRGNNLILRLSQTDRDAINRTAENNSVVPGSVLRIVSEADLSAFIEYEVVSNTDNGTWNSYEVVLTNTGTSGAPLIGNCQVYYEVATKAPTEYVRLDNHFAGNNFVSGIININDSGDTLDDNAYGFDVLIQKYTKSPDWDIVSTDGGASGGGANSWTALRDTEATLEGRAGAFPTVNADENKLELIPPTKLRVTKSDNQSFPPGTTKIQYNSVSDDTLVEWNNGTSTWTAKYSGTYLVAANIGLNGGWSEGERASVEIFVNGSSPSFLLVYVEDNTNSSFYDKVLGGMDVLRLSAGDQLDVRLFHNRGVNIDMFTDGRMNRLTITRIGS